ncbi:triose-phosphate isomerase [Lacisediminihabitans sp. FW035]
MNSSLSGPFFEIGPKNLLRLAELEEITKIAGAAGAEFGVSVVVTVPTAFVSLIAGLSTGVLVFAQEMSVDKPGPSFGTVTAEALLDAGAAGVMLNHDSNPLDPNSLSLSVARAKEVGLAAIVCAGTESDAERFASLEPDVILFEPPELIGTVGGSPRNWIAQSNQSVHRAYPDVLMMHAGGVGSPEIAEAIMAAGADGTGSTSGVLGAIDPPAAARRFIAATRAGWNTAHSNSPRNFNASKFDAH